LVANNHYKTEII